MFLYYILHACSKSLISLSIAIKIYKPEYIISPDSTIPKSQIRKKEEKEDLD